MNYGPYTNLWSIYYGGYIYIFKSGDVNSVYLASGAQMHFEVHLNFQTFKRKRGN